MVKFCIDCCLPLMSKSKRIGMNSTPNRHVKDTSSSEHVQYVRVTFERSLDFLVGNPPSVEPEFLV